METELLSYAFSGLLVIVFFISIALAFRFSDGHVRLRKRLKSRLIYGLPVGSMITIVTVLAVYLFLQGGIHDWDNPVVHPFRSWSYFYPTGTVASGFAHGSPSHLTSNLTTTLILAPIAEYIWGHYPDGQGGTNASRDQPWYRYPIIRACVLFPGAAFVIAVLTGAFSLGSVIGFSGVVFAFGGFAVVYYPIITVVGLLVVGVVRTILDGLVEPISFAGVTSTLPGWTSTAVQGHGLGFLIGVLLGITLLYHRNKRPRIFELFVALLIYGLTRGLWQIYRPLGGNEFVLYRALGVSVVLIGAVLVTATVVASKRPLFEGSSVTQREAGVISLVAILAFLIGPGIVTNLVIIDYHDEPADDELAVEDYIIGYDENAENPTEFVFDAPGTDETIERTSSGVYVASDQRQLWIMDTSQNQLRSTGTADIQIGGIGWRETVTAERDGLQVLGAQSVYAVELRHDDQLVTAYESNASTANIRIDNRSISFAPDIDDRFTITVEGSDGVEETASIPSVNESVEIGGIMFRASETNGTKFISAERDGTVTTVAQEE
ncbi:rhomboid family intramembrane serine protease [Salinarchaeum sp. IM2453]|uniref:rhomboid family intramembrane serine protease n=1 Tax=Salinarchaeum sp. IM2453 TaxID=2862870 RepID=UPI001C838582|nr:rhomboid family intramembrane serine protease [Salinarchaeum sp. IM2453]QZA88157.1 rhomboid family intramembrane serine protease [Salinarchaeum sp. IM2453]